MKPAVDPAVASGAGLRYALILGQGRSGTNFLLQLLDMSLETHCRNEADRPPLNVLHVLDRHRYYVEDADELQREWDGAFRRAAMRMAARDPHVFESAGLHPKRWLYPGTRGAGSAYLTLLYKALHRYAGRSARPLNFERQFPFWMTSTARLERALHVFKLNSACGVAGWMLEHRPQGRAVHIVRHPGGFLRSWLNRWVHNGRDLDYAGNEKDVDGKNRSRLKIVTAHEPEWADRIGDVDALPLVETELWFWRWCNERIAAAGEGRPAYRRVIFEDLSHHPLDVTRDVYGFLDLAWDDRIEALVREKSRPSKGIATAWKDELEPDVVASVERVLDGSPMTAWWPS
jgi:hypothetical protein